MSSENDILSELIQGNSIIVPFVDIEDKRFLHGFSYYGGKVLPKEWAVERTLKVTGDTEIVSFCLQTTSPSIYLTAHDIHLAQYVILQLR